jgi:hypothetical protein
MLILLPHGWLQLASWVPVAHGILERNYFLNGEVDSNPKFPTRKQACSFVQAGRMRMYCMRAHARRGEIAGDRSCREVIFVLPSCSRDPF